MDIPQGYKQTELGIIPDDWEVKRISDFTSIITGGTPSTLRPEYWGGNIMWMSSGELNKKFVFDVEGRITMGHRTKRFFQWSGKMGERF